jgi:hypothetical protein
VLADVEAGFELEGVVEHLRCGDFLDAVVLEPPGLLRGVARDEVTNSLVGRANRIDAPQQL